MAWEAAGRAVAGRADSRAVCRYGGLGTRRELRRERPGGCRLGDTERGWWSSVWMGWRLDRGF
jgi:hypothetical protein